MERKHEAVPSNPPFSGWWAKQTFLKRPLLDHIESSVGGCPPSVDEDGPGRVVIEDQKALVVQLPAGQCGVAFKSPIGPSGPLCFAFIPDENKPPLN